MADMATASLIYRKTAGSGAPEVNTLATLKTDLGLTGTNSGDQTITLTGDVTGSGTGSFAATIANDAVSNAKLANMAQATIKGREAGSGTGDPVDLTATQARTALGLGDAATGTVMTSEVDNTVGRVASFFSNLGIFGLGGVYGPLLADLDATSIPAGLYFFNTASGTAGTNPGFALGAVIVVSGIASGTKAPLMIALQRSSTTGAMAWRTSQAGTWGAWQTVSAVGHTHAWADITSGTPTTLAGYGITDAQPAITTTEAVLTAPVDLTSNNTWTDAVTLSLAAGTWLITGHITMQRQVTSATTFMARISDNTSHWASGQQYQASNVNNNGTTITMNRVVTLGATTTVRLQGLCTSGANSTDNRIIAQLSANASGDTSTVLTALRLA